MKVADIQIDPFFLTPRLTVKELAKFNEFSSSDDRAIMRGILSSLDLDSEEIDDHVAYFGMIWYQIVDKDKYQNVWMSRSAAPNSRCYPIGD